MSKISELVRRLKNLENKGLIGKVRPAISFTDEPKFPQWFCQPNPNFQEASDEQYGSSLSLNDNVAKLKAIAEGIERYCSATICLEKIVLGSYESLSYQAVDPAQFVNYANKLLNNERERYIQKLRKSKLRWVEGTHLNTKKPILIPAQLVYSPYDLSQEPLIRAPISTGAAFGENESSALERGLLEIIERDSFILSWLKKDISLLVDLEKSRFGKTIEYFKRYNLKPYIFNITRDLRIPVMMGLILDYTNIGPAVSVGLKASLNPSEAAIGALLEAQHVRGWIRFSYIKDGKPKINTPQEIIDLKTRGYYWYPKESIQKLDFLLETKEIKRLPRKEDILNGKSVAEYLIGLQFEVYSVDLSTKQVYEEGFRVIKAIVPKLHPLSLDADMPYESGERLNAADCENLNKIPHPFL